MKLCSPVCSGYILYSYTSSPQDLCVTYRELNNLLEGSALLMVRGIMNEGDLHNSLASLAVKVYGCHKYSSGFLGRNPCANNGRRAAAAELGGSEQPEQRGPRCPALGTPGTQEGTGRAGGRPCRGWLGQRQKVQQVNNNGQEEREGLTGLVHLPEEP